MADKRTFKKLMSAIESDHNPEAEHKPVPGDMHKGTSAIGQYGMMPVTLQDIARQLSDKTELDKLIQSADPTTVKEILQSNPQKYEQYSDVLAEKVLKKSQGDPQEAALKWRWGPSTKKSIEDNPEYKKRVEEKIGRASCRERV
jgi:hypothetical protein